MEFCLNTEYRPFKWLHKKNMAIKLKRAEKVLRDEESGGREELVDEVLSLGY